MDGQCPTSRSWQPQCDRVLWRPLLACFVSGAAVSILPGPHPAPEGTHVCAQQPCLLPREAVGVHRRNFGVSVCAKPRPAASWHRAALLVGRGRQEAFLSPEGGVFPPSCGQAQQDCPAQGQGLVSQEHCSCARPRGQVQPGAMPDRTCLSESSPDSGGWRSSGQGAGESRGWGLEMLAETPTVNTSGEEGVSFLLSLL